MKKFVLAALAASTAAIAMPAAGQTVSGTVNLTGTVAPKCLAVSDGPAAASFTRNVDFEELAQADGTLRTDLSAEFADEVAAVRVVCTSGAPTIAVNANPMVNSAADGDGYDNSIDYTAKVAVTLTGGSVVNFSNSTTAAPLAATLVGGRLAGTGSNLVITADTFATDAPTDVLVAGTYNGSITIDIAPAAVPVAP